MEKGYCYWGAEVSPDYTPFDAGIGFTVSLDKGPFIGREALLKIKDKGAPWKLRTFTLEADRPMLLHGGETITCSGRVVGVVTSGGFGHTVGKTIAMGYLSTEDTQATEGFAVEVFGEAFPATLVTKACYDPERLRIFL